MIFAHHYILYLRERNGYPLSAEQQVRLITEYRTSLIADVVTGKLDVRHAELPALEESEEELTVEEDATDDAIEPDKELETAEEHADVTD